VLVHADRDPEVALAEPDRVRGQREGARRGHAAVVDVAEWNAREPEQRDHRVGVVALVAPGEGELDLAPLDARIREGAPDVDLAHLDRRHAREAAERLHSHAYDRDVHLRSSLRPPAGSALASVRRVSTFTSSASST
jgi:hypothetical protein